VQVLRGLVRVLEQLVNLVFGVLHREKVLRRRPPSTLSKKGGCGRSPAKILCDNSSKNPVGLKNKYIRGWVECGVLLDHPPNKKILGRNWFPEWLSHRMSKRLNAAKTQGQTAQGVGTLLRLKVRPPLDVKTQRHTLSRQ
jgi:hypothetical protein